MPDVDLHSVDGKVVGKVELPDEIYGIEPNVAVMHQVVTAQLAAARSGTHSTKTRAEVRGGGTKPWRQKGTGRARAGSIRSPIWVGGGRAHGPRPRDYAQRTPRKMRKLALRSALSDRVASSAFFVVDEWDISTPKTRSAVEAIESLGLEGKTILLVVQPDEVAVERSFRNLEQLSTVAPGELNTYDILKSDILLSSLSTLEQFPGAGGELKVTKSKKTKAPAAKAEPEADEEGDGK